MSRVWFITGAGRGFGREFTPAQIVKHLYATRLQTWADREQASIQAQGRVG